jgi:uncharacterized membrane protein YkoI
VKDKLKGVIIAVAAIAALAVGGAAIAGAAGGGGGKDSGGSDQAITGTALDQASAAALKATGGGKVTQTEVGDEESYYQVEVTRADGSQVDVQLDRSFQVVGQKAEHADAGGSKDEKGADQEQGGDHEQGADQEQGGGHETGADQDGGAEGGAQR